MNEHYDNINNFYITNNKYLFFDIFHKDNEIFLICPLYTTNKSELQNNINEITFFNVSIEQYKYINILRENNIDISKMEYYNDKNIKIPWIDIFPYKKMNSYPIIYKYIKEKLGNI